MSSHHEVIQLEWIRSKLVKHRDWKHKSDDRTRSHSSKSSKHRPQSRERGESKHKHKKSKMKERHLSSRGSTSDSSEELRWLQRLEAERLRLKEEKKNQKEQLKANETPREKRARRLRKKQEKERKYREQMGWDNEYQCYTNQDNPFGDPALTDTFVWTKKLVKEGMKIVSRDELEALSRQKQLENKIELKKVKQRRLEFEAVRVAKSEKEVAAAALQSHTWARREDAFQLHQARLRSLIRIRDGRAKPIDLLAKYVSSEECVDALEMHEPHAYLNGLQSQDLEDLLEDIKVYKELETKANQTYWEDVQTIVLDKLDKLRRLAAPHPRRHAVHRAVADDITQIFKGKTVAQLEVLQTQMEHKMRGRRDGVDVAYWESLLSQLKAHMSRARLHERHQRCLRRQLQPLQRERAGMRAAATQDAKEPRRSQSPEVERAAAPVSTRGSGVRVLESGAEQCLELYRAGRYSPAPLGSRALPPGAQLTEAAHDEARRRARLRSSAAGRQVLNQMAPVVGSVGATTEVQRAPAAAYDHLFSVEHTLLEQPQFSVEHALPEQPQFSVEHALPEQPQFSVEDALPEQPQFSVEHALPEQPQFSVEHALPEQPQFSVEHALPEQPQFSVEHALPEQPRLWPDKYRPRKPRYFNRVHTGFEWNKYNQTHYDVDNPPPKIVQGYQFNIFYPDLIDKNATPEFSLKACPKNPDLAVLRFHAGPPYEDIAFKIVNREWEHSYARGFRCHFRNNIFQLWFHFKRYRYRR